MPGTILCKVGKGCTVKANAVIFSLKEGFLCQDFQPQTIVNEFVESERGEKVVGYDKETKNSGCKKY